jgi:Werner syndrome ATP-dependent helicase
MLVPWIDTSLSLLVSCGEFLEGLQPESSAFPAQSNETSLSGCLDQGPTIVYVPTRKETVELANFLCKSGLRAAAYNAKVVIIAFLYV